MMITDVTCTVLVVPDCNANACDSAQDTILVEVHTDEGITGIGETDANPWVIKAIIEAPGSHIMSLGLKELVVGQNPTEPVAVWQLLGGAQKEFVTPYASLLPSGTTLEDYRRSLLEKARWARDFGFRAAKMEICIKGPYAHNLLREGDDAIVELVGLCREAVGPEMTMMVDVAYAWSDWKEALRVMRRIEPFDIFFLETPLPSDDLEGYARLANATNIRIAAGEWLTTRFEFAELMDRGNIDVAQPDIGRVGGITEAMRVAQMAQDRGKLIVPHCWKTGIGAAATAHFAAATSNCRFIEFLPPSVAESALRRDLVQEELQIADGKLDLPRRPGLGIELNAAAVLRFAKGAEDYAEVRQGLSAPQLS